MERMNCGDAARGQNVDSSYSGEEGEHTRSRTAPPWLHLFS